MDQLKPPHNNMSPNDNNTRDVMAETRDISDSMSKMTLDIAEDPISESMSRLNLETEMPLSPYDSLSRTENLPHAPRRARSNCSLRDGRRKSSPVMESHIYISASNNSNSNHTMSSESPRHISANLPDSPPAMDAPDPLPHTAASISAEYFRKEVELHNIVDLKSKTVVVLHDDCYGHRVARHEKIDKHTFPERPERILACTVGISAAYVRMGRRYAGEMYAPHPDLDVSLLPPPPFQLHRTSRFVDIEDKIVTNVHGEESLHDLKADCEALKPDGSGAPLTKLESGDLYLCLESKRAFEGAMGGVCDGVDAVLGPSQTTRAFVCIRPPGHHCSSDIPSGFCWINNVHVGISYAAMNHGLTHAAIFDFDLHHGDGSQDITWKHNKKLYEAMRSSTLASASNYDQAAIGYYSLHDINSFPCEDGDMDKIANASICVDAHAQSIWNVHLESWETKDEFWILYETKYKILLQKARLFLRSHTEKVLAEELKLTSANLKSNKKQDGKPKRIPKAAIFISAGFDASQWEAPSMQRHKVNVPTGFYARFTADIVRLSQEEGLGTDGRVISVLEGGYSDRALTSGVLSHLTGLGHDPIEETNKSERVVSNSPKRSRDESNLQYEYDSEWWSPACLDELHDLTSPSPPKKGRRKAGPAGPSFLRSTQSFSAKVVSPTFDHKFFDPGEPLLPQVGWATAAHELSKILIPDRQTTSYQPGELRPRRKMVLDNSSTATPVQPADEKRQLRVRKTKSPLPEPSRSVTPRQQATRKSRRTTIGSSEVQDQSVDSSPSAGASRRKSLSSTPATVTEPTETVTGPTETVAEQEKVAFPSSVSGTGKIRRGTPRRIAPKKPPPVPKVPTTFQSKVENQGSSTSAETPKPAARKLKLVMPSAKAQAVREKKVTEGYQLTQKGTRALKTAKSPKKANGSRAACGNGPEKADFTPISTPIVPPMPSEFVTHGVEVKTEPSDTQCVSTTAVTSSFSRPSMDVSESTTSDLIVPIMDPVQAMTKPEQTHFAQDPTSLTVTPELAQIAENFNQPSYLFSPQVSAAETKSGLPVFTSSSPIPFASPDNLSSGSFENIEEKKFGSNYA